MIKITEAAFEMKVIFGARLLRDVTFLKSETIPNYVYIKVSAFNEEVFVK